MTCCNAPSLHTYYLKDCRNSPQIALRADEITDRVTVEYRLGLLQEWNHVVEIFRAAHVEYEQHTMGAIP